ncbi:ferritin-like domain-containing protein [Hymenobacter actinosclerus]|uniref:Ferritin-like domain-containing protein n=1 Tax=Hymenobacter actinosclerus TaxID=82805 RepID=A0A1I0H8F8_9BACT|nr:ferritin-like domain-containing protein [Hymenobacter actinosclerus]SET79148.1 Ferritin-like domain-containing protein [Hymenobacter actinosclerus]
MDFLNLLARLADLDSTSAAPHTAAPRRAALGRLGQAGTALLPGLLLSALSQPATAGTLDTRTRLDVLLLTRQLAALGNELYSRALGLVPGYAALPLTATEKAGLQVIQQQETQRITLFSQLITDGGATLPAAPRYDFTGSKNGTKPALYPDIQTNPDTFLLVAQVLKDLAVRVYKSQVEFVGSDAYLIETLLRSHSAEARHAAHLRTLRRQRGAVVKSWISPDDAPLATPPAAVARVYEGESNIIQTYNTSAANGDLGPLVSVPFDSTLPINVATPPLSPEAILRKVAEAFDEPADAVVAINVVALFTY